MFDLKDFRYDYEEAIIEDIMDFLEDNIEYGKEAMDDSELEDWLNDACWVSDQVTGNASGSYTFSTFRAETHLCHNWELLLNMCDDFGEDLEHAIRKGPEYCDVSIRCYLLSQMIPKAIKKWRNKHAVQMDKIKR